MASASSRDRRSDGVDHGEGNDRHRRLVGSYRRWHMVGQGISLRQQIRRRNDWIDLLVWPVDYLFAVARRLSPSRFMTPEEHARMQELEGMIERLRARSERWRLAALAESQEIGLQLAADTYEICADEVDSILEGQTTDQE